MASALLKPDINTVHRAPTTAAPAPAIGCIPIVSATATTAAHAMPAVSALPNTLPVLRFQVATRVSSQFSLAGVRSVDVPLGLITARRLLPLDVLGVRFTHERFQLLSDRPSCRDGLSELTELVVDGLVDRKPRAFQPVGVGFHCKRHLCGNVLPLPGVRHHLVGVGRFVAGHGPGHVMSDLSSGTSSHCVSSSS